MDLAREEPPNPQEGVRAPLEDYLWKVFKQQIQEEEGRL